MRNQLPYGHYILTKDTIFFDYITTKKAPFKIILNKHLSFGDTDRTHVYIV